jgi:hypothetical protein
MTHSQFELRSAQAERFQLMRLLQGLLILDTFNSCRPADSWSGIVEATALDAVRRAVDMQTAAYWHGQISTPDTPRPTEAGWTHWRDVKRKSLDAAYAALPAAPRTPAPGIGV